MLAFALVLCAACGDATGTVRLVCRGDSVEAFFCDTCLVKCSTVDTLARRSP